MCEPTPFAPRGHLKSHVHNNEEIAFVYTEIHVFLALLRKGPTKIPLGKCTLQENMKPFHAKMKVNTVPFVR